MGFLLRRPQLLSELWDRVSPGNNRRPLEKTHSEPGNRQKEQGPTGRGRGGRSWPNADQARRLPTPLLRGQLRGTGSGTDDAQGAGGCGPPSCSGHPTTQSRSFWPGWRRQAEMGTETRTELGVACGSRRKGVEKGGQDTNTDLQSVPTAAYLRQGQAQGRCQKGLPARGTGDKKPQVSL